MYVTELFKEFQKDRLKEAKKSDYDYMQEIYANTELFDFTNIPYSQEFGYSLLSLKMSETKDKYIMSIDMGKFSMPFENVFVLNAQSEEAEEGFFIREKEPNFYSCAIYNLWKNKKQNLPYSWGAKQNIPLFIDFNNQIIWMYKKDFIFSNAPLYQKMLQDKKLYLIKGLIFKIPCLVIENFNKLSERSILTDIPYNQTEYYAFKDKSKKTIKVTNRPIYYVLDKKDYEKKNYNIKSIGKLEYSHAFKVRGHWRRIDEKSVGKDRTGNYKIKGFTWVIDHIRGQGELVNRVRIVK